MNTEAIRMKMLLELRQILDEIKMELPLLKKNLNLAYEESSKINGHDSESSNEKKRSFRRIRQRLLGILPLRVTSKGLQKSGQQIDSRKRKLKFFESCLKIFVLKSLPLRTRSPNT